MITFAELDTSHFKGNAPGAPPARHRRPHRPTRRPDGLVRPAAADAVCARTPGTASRSSTDPVATHVRLDIYPDGGMARLRLHGRPDGAVLRARYEAVT